MKSLSCLAVFFLMLLGCKSSAPLQDTIPAHETFTIESNILKEPRVINIWTPPNYSTISAQYPVLYMADGGLKEDFPHIANTLSNLIASNRIPPMILVGIENTQRRRDLTGPTEIEEDKKIAPIVGGSEEFRAFIKDELFPIIEKKYRASAQKSIIGESLSGLFVVETFLKEPEMFDNYIAFDPSLWWNNHSLIQSASDDLAKFPAQKKRFWFAGSGTAGISEYTAKLHEILEKSDRSNIKWNYSPEPAEEHATIFRATKEKALIWTFGNK